MALWLVWIVIAICNVCIEAMYPTVFVCLPIAIACIPAAICAWAGLSIAAQCGAASITVVASLYTFYQWSDAIASSPRTNVYALIGSVGYVTHPIEPYSKGYVTINGTTWLARSDRYIPQGVYVQVQDVQGCHVHVTPYYEETV